jgi:hypothetical protein
VRGGGVVVVVVVEGGRVEVMDIGRVCYAGGNVDADARAKIQDAHGVREKWEDAGKILGG